VQRGSTFTYSPYTAQTAVTLFMFLIFLFLSHYFRDFNRLLLLLRPGLFTLKQIHLASTARQMLDGR
jgi:hypothetical protein